MSIPAGKPMQVAVLSPHRDDAAFSCSLTLHALLQAGAQVTVFNVFTQSDYAVDFGTVDPALPLVDAVSQARRLEDEAFVSDLARSAGREEAAVRLRDLHWLDAPLRLTVPTERVLSSPLTDAAVHEEALLLAGQLGSLRDCDLVWAPLALGGHIDHRVARQAACLCLPKERLCWYEDLPYTGRLTVDERNHQTRVAMQSNDAADFSRVTLRLRDGVHLRRRFASLYPSQIAPDVVDEMADYTAQGACIGDGVERWWAMPAVAHHVAGVLRAANLAASLVQEQQ